MSGSEEMEESFVPLRGIKNDVRGRLACYKQDWTGGFSAGIRYARICLRNCSSLPGIVHKILE